MRAVRRGLGFPAPWMVLLPCAPKLLQQAPERTALHEQDHQHEIEVQEQGKVSLQKWFRERCD